jgi:hypothetical protein
MNASSRVTAFAALLAAIFGIALVAGKAIDPKGGDARAADDAADTAPAMDGMAGADGHAQADGKTDGASAPAPGLAVADPKLRLVAGRTTLPAGRSEAYTFSIVDAHGETVRDLFLQFKHHAAIHTVAFTQEVK